MSQTAPAKILIVDDDPGLVVLIQKALRREGFATGTASSGKEAMDWLGRNHADLMLLDLKLSDIQGRELINRLTDLGRALPFVVITGQGDEREAVDMMKRGARDYLVKDVQFIEFVPAVVRRVLEQLERDRRLADTQAALAESQRQLLAVSEREQRRFGAELHDGLGQQLTAIELYCESVRSDLAAFRPDLEIKLSQICTYLREAIGYTRSLARGLSPVNLEAEGLAGALHQLALRMNDSGHIQCAFECPTPVVVEDTLIAGHLFRIAQEAVNNAFKHAGASRVTIRLTRDQGTLRLEIGDDGVGMPKRLPPGQGMGLQIMGHRASLLGGSLDFQSKAGQGLTIICTLPSPKPSA